MNPIHPTIVWLTWRQIFASRRIYFALLFSLAPLVNALAFQQFSGGGVKDVVGAYMLLERETVIGVFLPLAALVFGTLAFGGEIDDGTLVYLLVKPVARWRVVLSKYVVAASSAFLLTLPGVFLPWLVLKGPTLPIGIPIAVMWGVLLGAILYGAFFTMLGLVQKHALVVGLMYVVIFEETLARTIAGVRTLSIREFSNAFALHMADPAFKLGDPLVTMATVRTMGAIFLVGGIALTVYKLGRYQMAERI